MGLKGKEENKGKGREIITLHENKKVKRESCYGLRDSNSTNFSIKDRFFGAVVERTGGHKWQL